MKNKLEKTNNTPKCADAEASSACIVRRCGQCLFAEGGEKKEFRNGDINYWYHCNLSRRTDNIVLLEYDDTSIVWENQRACEHFEKCGASLTKRSDLDINKYHFTGEGHFQINA